tara:strand:- start:874 stop:1371 length:498 start_codon:yes stop_codon:yes gene_type:complete
MSVGPTLPNDPNSATLEFGKGDPIKIELSALDAEVNVTSTDDMSELVSLRVVGGAFDGAFLTKQKTGYYISRLANPAPIAWRVDTVGHLVDTGIATLTDNTCLVLTPTQNQKPPHEDKRASESRECAKVVKEATELEFHRFFSITQRARDCCSHLMERGFIVECN